MLLRAVAQYQTHPVPWLVVGWLDSTGETFLSITEGSFERGAIPLDQQYRFSNNWLYA